MPAISERESCQAAGLLGSALWYASIGWKVFPCVPREKRPATNHGVKDATTDAGKIQSWWTAFPDYNIGLACGKDSGIYAVDIDIDEEAKVNGFDSLRQFFPIPDTIAQVTPRGGSHLLFKTDNPPANKNGLLPGVDIRGDGYYVLLAPSVGPNGIKYMWMDGKAPGQIAAAKYPDFLRPAARPEPTPGVVTFKGIPIDPTDAIFEGPDPNRRDFGINYWLREDGLSSGVEIRAAKYLQECDPAVQGQAGHDKLLWAAVAMVHGFKLKAGPAGNLLRDHFNPRCDPPWDMDDPGARFDFFRKVDEAKKLSPSRPYGWLLAKADCSNVDIESIISSNKKSQEKAKLKPAPYDWDSGADSLYKYLVQPTGLLGDICMWINSTARRQQPMLSLAAALSFCGTLYGRRIRGEDDSRTNLYCIGVAPSSAGKNHAMNQIRALATAGGCDDRIGGTKFASESAIEKRLSTNPACLFMCDEIGHKLVSMKNDKTGHKTDIIATLMELYSMATETFKGKEYATAEQRILVQPCCSLYGVSEHGRLLRAIDADELSDGWIARCMVFDCGDRMPPASDTTCDKEPPTKIVEAISAWEHRLIQPEKTRLSDFMTIKDGRAVISPDLPPNMLEVKYTQEASDVFQLLDENSVLTWELCTPTGPLWMKSAEKAKRIAIIVAASENPDSPVVSAENAIYACRLVSYLLIEFERNIASEVSSCFQEAEKRKLLKIVRDTKKEGISQRKLTRKTQWARTRKNRREMIDDLTEGGFIVAVDENAEHAAESDKQVRPKIRYWTLEQFPGQSGASNA